MGGPKTSLEEIFTQQIDLFLSQEVGEDWAPQLARTLVWHVRERLDWADSYRDDMLK